MTDNVAVTAGAGTNIAADEVVDGTLGTVKAQFVKIMDGTLDSINKLVIDTSGYVYAKIAPRTPTIVAGNQTLTISTASVSLTVPGTATHAFVTVETGDIRYWEDGTTPTASTGLYLPAGASAELANPSNLRFIKATGMSDASLNVSYRKYV